MAKDPAFLFYSQDFYSGVADLTFEERGQFITILCQMHQKGHLREETIRFMVGSVSVNLKSKFGLDEKGLWYNNRLDFEIEARRNFTESRRINGLKGGRPKSKKPTGKPKNNLMEDEIEIVNEVKNWDSIKRNFTNAYEWKEDFCRKKNITLPDLESKMQEYISDTELREDYKPLKELKSHFTNTFNKNKNGSQFNQSGGKLGTSAARIKAARDF